MLSEHFILQCLILPKGSDLLQKDVSYCNLALVATKCLHDYVYLYGHMYAMLYMYLGIFNANFKYLRDVQVTTQ